MIVDTESNGNGKYVTMKTFVFTVGGLGGLCLIFAGYFLSEINEIKAARERNVQYFEKRVSQLEIQLENMKGK